MIACTLVIVMTMILAIKYRHLMFKLKTPTSKVQSSSDTKDPVIVDPIVAKSDKSDVLFVIV